MTDSLWITAHAFVSRLSMSFSVDERFFFFFFLIVMIYLFSSVTCTSIFIFLTISPFFVSLFFVATFFLSIFSYHSLKIMFFFLHQPFCSSGIKVPLFKGMSPGVCVGYCPAPGFNKKVHVQYLHVRGGLDKYQDYEDH